MEITRDGEAVSPGEEGEVTVTNLDNRAMPFIRYDLEDLGVLDEGGCSCGNTLPRMRLTEGRKRGAVKLPDGRVIPAMVVTGGLPYVNGVKQFQVTQERIDRFSLKVVKGVGFSEETLEEVEKSLKRVLGEVEIVLSLVDDIPREKSGKFRPFMTRVPA